MDNGSKSKKEVDWRGIGEKTVKGGKIAGKVINAVVHALEEILNSTSTKNKC